MAVSIAWRHFGTEISVRIV